MLLVLHVKYPCDSVAHLKGPLVSVNIPQFSGLDTSASSDGSQTGSGLVSGLHLWKHTQLVNTLK